MHSRMVCISLLMKTAGEQRGTHALAYAPSLNLKRERGVMCAAVGQWGSLSRVLLRGPESCQQGSPRAESSESHPLRRRAFALRRAPCRPWRPLQAPATGQHSRPPPGAGSLSAMSAPLSCIVPEDVSPDDPSGQLRAGWSCWWMDPAAAAAGPRDTFGPPAGWMELLADGPRSGPAARLHCYANFGCTGLRPNLFAVGPSAAAGARTRSQSRR